MNDESSLAAPSETSVPFEPKIKRTAVVFAICFGLFSWLYTYKRDKGTFWIMLVCSFGTGGRWFIGAWIFAVILALSRSEAWYAWYPFDPSPGLQWMAGQPGVQPQTARPGEIQETAGSS